MGLHDVGKNSDSRGMAMPNAGDVSPSRMAHGTFGVTLAEGSASASAGKMVFRDGKIEIYRNDGTLVGRFGVRPADSDGAVDVARPGDEL